MLIRDGHEADAAAIARVHVDTWRATYTGIIPDSFLDNLSYERSEAFWRDHLSTPAGIVCVAENDESQIVGFATGGQEREGNTQYQGEVYAIYLLAEYQRQGIGRQLIVAIARQLMEHGIYSMLIWVLADNPSRAFYETLGGQPVYDKEITVGGATFVEVAYAWQDIRPLADNNNG